MLSLVRNDPFFRLQRRLHLIPAEGLGIVRRAIFWSLFTWLPIIVWGVASGRVLADPSGEPVLAHFGVHIRALIAIPLFIAAEGMAHGVTTQLIPELLRTGIVPEREAGKFEQILASVAALRDSVLPWLLVLAIAAAMASMPITTGRAHELGWTAPPGASGYGFGGFWLLYIAKPVYYFFLLAWIWRVVLLFRVCRKVAGLDLELVATHPDRIAGLACIDRLSVSFSLVVLAISASVCSGWAHDAIYHGLDVHTLFPHFATFIVVALAVFLSPFAAFCGRLVRLKRQALLDYGALIAKHDRLVDQRWIHREPIDDREILDAPELGPVADIHQLYVAVSGLRVLPVTLRTVLAILVPAAIPIVCVLAIQIPLKAILGTLLKAIA